MKVFSENSLETCSGSSEIGSAKQPKISLILPLEGLTARLDERF